MCPKSLSSPVTQEDRTKVLHTEAPTAVLLKIQVKLNVTARRMVDTDVSKDKFLLSSGNYEYLPVDNAYHSRRLQS